MTSRTTDDAAPDWRALNRANWDERVPVHLASELYDLTALREAGRACTRTRRRNSARSTGSRSFTCSATSVRTP